MTFEIQVSKSLVHTQYCLVSIFDPFVLLKIIFKNVLKNLT